MIKKLRAAFHYTLLDLGHELNESTIHCLDISDKVLLITTPDLPSLCATKTALKTFRKLDYPEDKVKLILNRWGIKNEIELELIEKNLNFSITTVLSSV